MRGKSRHLSVALAAILFALGALLLAKSMFGAGVTVKVSEGRPASTVYLPSLPQPTDTRVVYVQDAVTPGAQELWSASIEGGTPVRLSNALQSGQSVKFKITPDGQRVVYQTDQTVRGIPDLYSTPITGGASVKLSMDLSSGVSGQVRDFIVSPTSLRAYYAADGGTREVMELWRVDIGGGPSTKLNSGVTGSYDVWGYEVSPQDQIVYRVGSTVQGHFALWTVPGNGRSSQARRISTYPMVTGGGVSATFKITADGAKVLYVADAEQNGRFNLYVVAITGGASHRLNAGSGGVVAFLERDVNGVPSVLFEQTIGAVKSWWSVSLEGGTPAPAPTPIDPPVKSPDGQWTIRVFGGTDLVASRGAVGRLVSCRDQILEPTFLAKPTYSVTPDSKRVVYVASGEVWSSPISGAVCLVFNDGFESGGTERWQ